METDIQEANKRWASPWLYAACAAGIVLVAFFAAWSWNSGGLPGTQNSPSATVQGQSTTGKAASD